MAADLVGHLDPFLVLDAIEVEVSSWCFAFDDIYGLGVFGQGREIQAVAVQLATTLEMKLLWSQRNIHRLEERVTHVAAAGPDIREWVYLYPAAIDVVIWGFVPEVYAGIGVGEFDTLDTQFVGVIGIGVEPPPFVDLHFEGLCLRHFFSFFGHFYFHVVVIF